MSKGPAKRHRASFTYLAAPQEHTEVLTPSAQDALSRAFSHAGEALRRAVLTRFLNLTADVLERASTATLSQAASARSDLTAVLTALEDPDVASELPWPASVIVTARARGLEARQQLLAAEGGTWGVAQVARHLHLTRQAVDHRRRAGRLIGLPVGRHGYRYPAWQFSEKGTLAGLDRVLPALRNHDPWGQIIFLLSPHPDLNSSPMSALRAGRVEEVVEAAAAFAEHGVA